MVADFLSRKFRGIIKKRSDKFITYREVSTILDDVALQALLHEDSVKLAGYKHRSAAQRNTIQFTDASPIAIGEAHYPPDEYLEILKDRRLPLAELRDLEREVNLRIQRSQVYINRIRGNGSNSPSRLLLLAILIYGRRTQVISRFLAWLRGELDDAGFPHDGQLPLSMNQNLKDLFDEDDAEEIIDLQKFFLPFRIEKDAHRKIPKGLPKPFVEQDIIGEGASGKVFKVKIPTDYWLDRQDQSPKQHDQNAPEPCVIVAVKRFQSDANTADKSAFDNYSNERRALDKVKGFRSRHNHVMLDIGSLEESFEKDTTTIYWMFFPIGTCDLHDFLTNEEIQKPFSDPLTLEEDCDMYRHTVSIIDAVAWLHFNSIRHLDIKPSNILVFGAERSDMKWKISDFNLAHHDRPKLGPLRDMSRIINSDSARVDKAHAIQGIFQAPEVRELRDWEADQSSDVWAIGAVLLMVMTYMHGREAAVNEFMDDHLLLHSAQFNPKSFYVTSQMTEWAKVVPGQQFDLYTGKYLDTQDGVSSLSVLATTTKTALVAVNPKVVSWMDRLCDISKDRNYVVHRLYKQTWDYLRAEVLIPNKDRRHTAKALHIHTEDRLQKFQNPKEPQSYIRDSMDAECGHAPLQVEVSSPDDEDDGHEPLVNDKDEAITRNGSTQSGEAVLARASSETSPPALVNGHTVLCQLDTNQFRRALEETSAGERAGQRDVDQKCPKCRQFLIHQILDKKPQDRHAQLQALLDFRRPRTLREVSNHVTPFQVALGKNDHRALRMLLDHDPTLFDRRNEDLFNEEKRMNTLSRDTIKAVEKRKTKPHSLEQASSFAKTDSGSSSRRNTSTSDETSNSVDSGSKSFLSLRRKKH